MIKRVKVGGSLTFQKLAYQYHYIKASVYTNLGGTAGYFVNTIYLYR